MYVHARPGKWSLVGFFFFLAITALPLYAQLQIDVVYPKESQTVIAHDSTFIFGSTNNSNARVTINGLQVRMFPNGAFLGYVPITSGDFIFRCHAEAAADTVIALRHVFIPEVWQENKSDSVLIDTSYLFPATDIGLTQGDVLSVSFKGTPGMTASFSVPGLVEEGFMVASPPAMQAAWGELVFGSGEPIYPAALEGIYHGSYTIPPNAALDTALVYFYLRGPTGSAADTVVAPGRLTVEENLTPRVGVLTSEMTVARTGPGLGYQLFLPEGVKLILTGHEKGFFRARLTQSLDAWVPQESLRLLPAGSPQPGSVVSVVRSENRHRKVSIRIYLQEKLPFKVEQNLASSELLLSIYGAVSNTDWIRHDYEDDLIQDINWSQPDNDIYQLRIRLSGKQQWGFSAYYDGNALVLDVRKPPAKLSLKNMVVCLDPGHAPQDGAIGPTGIAEKNANLQLAKVLEKKLRKKGVVVFLTRRALHGAALSVRAKMATYLEADLFISLHYNALPDGIEPFENRGSSTYYYHQQSRPLAESIQTEMLKKLKLRNFGLYYDNLAVCRIQNMISVLVEPAFIMHPAEEMLITNKNFQKKTADAIVKGIERFLKNARD